MSFSNKISRIIIKNILIDAMDVRFKSQSEISDDRVDTITENIFLILTYEANSELDMYLGKLDNEYIKNEIYSEKQCKEKNWEEAERLIAKYFTLIEGISYIPYPNRGDLKTLKFNLGIYVEKDLFRELRQEVEDELLFSEIEYRRKGIEFDPIFLIAITWVGNKVLDCVWAQSEDFRSRIWSRIKDRCQELNSDKIIVNNKDFDIKDEEGIDKELLELQKEIANRIINNREK